MGAEHGPCRSPQDHHLADQRPVLDVFKLAYFGASRCSRVERLRDASDGTVDLLGDLLMDEFLPLERVIDVDHSRRLTTSPDGLVGQLAQRRGVGVRTSASNSRSVKVRRSAAGHTDNTPAR